MPAHALVVNVFLGHILERSVRIVFEYSDVVLIITDKSLNTKQMREQNAQQARMASLSTRLEQIKHSRNELFRQLEDLDVEFTAKQREYNSLQNSIAPISSLPNEVLAEIFITGHHLLLYDHAPFEILVSHVIHHWREIALGTSTLWVDIHRHERQHNMEPIAAYLQRSKLSPLRLVLEIGRDEEYESDLDGSVEESEEEDISLLCELIEPHLPRCRRLVIRSENSVQDLNILEWLASMSAPILQSLQIRLSLGQEHMREPLRILNGGAQFLTDVHLNGIDLIYCHPPVASVTTLRLDLDDWAGRNRAQFQELSIILSAMPNLVHLELATSCWPFEVPMLLSALHTIQYQSYDLDGASGLLVALIAPSLQHMTMYAMSPMATKLDERVALNGASNFPSLQRLYFSTAEGVVTLSDMRSLSRAFPYLTEIKFTVYQPAHAHIGQMLALTEDQSLYNGVGVWPQLHTLGICISYNGQFPTPELRNFLTKRATMGLPIRTLLLPESQLANGRELSSCTEPPVTIAELVLGYVPIYLSIHWYVSVSF